MKGTIQVAGHPRILNWRPSLPTRIPPATQPSTPMTAVSVLDKMPPILDQKNLGACTAFSFVAPAWIALGSKQFMISPLYQYYVERMIEHEVGQDSGATIADILRASHRYGVCPETAWPYDPAKFAEKPPQEAFDLAAQERTHVYAPVPLTPGYVHGCLAGGHPIMFGISVYESFENVGPDGIIPIPDPSEQLLGGHAIDIVAMNPTADVASFPLSNNPKSSLDVPAGYVVIRNSWGELWGDSGFGYMPMAYVTDPSLASDGWLLKSL